MIETVWDLTTTAATYHYMWPFNRVRNRSQLCYFDGVQMNMLQQRMLSKVHYSSRLQRMTLFHSPLEQKRHQISSQGSRHVRLCAVVFCSQSRIRTSDHDTTSERFQHGNEEPRWRNGTSSCCAQEKSQYHELAPHNKADDFARDREGHLVQRRTEDFETCGFLDSYVSTFGRKTIPKKTMSNKPLYIWPPRE